MPPSHSAQSPAIVMLTMPNIAHARTQPYAKIKHVCPSIRTVICPFFIMPGHRHAQPLLLFYVCPTICTDICLFHMPNLWYECLASSCYAQTYVCPDICTVICPTSPTNSSAIAMPSSQMPGLLPVLYPVICRPYHIYALPLIGCGAHAT